MNALRFVLFFFFFSSRRRHTRFDCDWSSDVCSSDLLPDARFEAFGGPALEAAGAAVVDRMERMSVVGFVEALWQIPAHFRLLAQDRKSTRLNSSHSQISYAAFCLKKKKRSHTLTEQT